MSDLHEAAEGHAAREVALGQIIDASTPGGFAAVFGRMPSPVSPRAAVDTGTHDALPSPTERVTEADRGCAGPFNWPRANTGD